MNIRGFFTKRRIIWTVIILVIVAIIGSQVFGGGNGAAGIMTESARAQDLKSTVLATGQVTSNTDLNLSFKGSGIVRRVNVKVGDKVRVGQLLANLDQRDQVAASTSARGSLASAQANYQRVLDGNSSEEVAVAQIALDNARQQQNTLVQNAKSALMNTGLEAELIDGQGPNTAVISGAYNSDIEGEYLINVYPSSGGKSIIYTGLESGRAFIDSTYQIPLGTRGLFISFPSMPSTSAELRVSIPNKLSATYVSNLNAYQAAMRNRDAAIASAQANLDLAKAAAKPADIRAAQAQILSAQGQVQSAQAALESTEIRASSAGTVTKIDIKVGELAGGATAAMVVQDVDSLYLEADISEANISEIAIGQAVEVTFDALGPDKKYSAQVSSIDPASTVVSGVVNYKIKAMLDQVEEIKPGMTANMSVLTGEKSGAIAVPVRAVVQKNGKKYIRVITDSKTKAYNEVEVTTGFEADGGLVEITSGVNAGQEIVTFIDAN